MHRVDERRIVLQHQVDHGAALGAQAEGQLVVGDHEHRAAVHQERLLRDGGDCAREHGQQRSRGRGAEAPRYERPV
jgi:hypothetical protein